MMSGENASADISTAAESTIIIQSSEPQISIEDDSSSPNSLPNVSKEAGTDVQHSSSLHAVSHPPKHNKDCNCCPPPGCRFKTKSYSKSLSFPQKILAGSGHILNDFCASMWFFYLLFYLEKVVGFSNTNSAILMLFGQIIDGLATPVVGLLADRPNKCWPCRMGYGKFKTWHLIGAFLVSLSFPFVFSRCLVCTVKSPDWVKAIYFSPFILIFQIGWAASQISHLALIPKLNPEVLIRTELLSIRYGFTIASNVIVFLITWLKLGFKSFNDECVIDVTSASTFRDLSLISVGVGVFFAMWFHLFVVEPDDEMKAEKEVSENAADIELPSNESDPKNKSLSKPDSGDVDVTFINHVEIDSKPPSLVPTTTTGTEAASDIHRNMTDTITIEYGTKNLNIQKNMMTMKDWLTLPQLYIVAFMYMSTRLSVNVTQVYVPLYVIESLHMSCSAIASVPLTMYCSGFIVAVIMKPVNKYCGRQLSYVFGAILCVVGSCLILTLEWTPGSNLVMYGTYGVAVLLGGGASAILVTSLSITADLIGDNVENGAFIYGTMSFCDKLSCGLVILLINSLNPCQKEGKLVISCAADAPFYSNVLGYTCGGCALLGVLGVMGLTVIIYIQNKRRRM